MLAGFLTAGPSPGLGAIFGRGHKKWWSSLAIERAERIESPGTSPTATAAIVTTQGGKSFMAPCAPLR
jgi:hypothetical protein